MELIHRERFYRTGLEKTEGVWRLMRLSGHAAGWVIRRLPSTFYDEKLVFCGGS